MSNHTSYLIFWMLIFVILGIFWYIIDRRYGVSIYRFWFKLSRKNPLPEEVVRGFVYKRKTRHKALMATVLSSAQSIIMLVAAAKPNLLVELILWIVEIPMTLIGFALGPWAYQIWNRKEKVFDTIDDLESGKTSVTDLIRFSGERGASEEPAPLKPADTEKEKPVTPPTGKNKPEDPRDMIRRYTNRE